jgi:iron complex transport system substrate-binding protein
MRNRTIAIIMLALLCSALPLFAMGTREQDGTLSMRSATDALGRRVVVNGDINRILVVGKAAVMPADALFFFPAVEHMEIELAKTDQGLGDFFDLIRPELAGQARLGQNIGAEEIIARKPDLVITKSSNYETTGKQLEPFGIPVFVMDLETPEAWKQEIVQLGILLGDNETPVRIIGEFERRERSVTDRLGSLPCVERPSVLMVQAAKADGATSFSIAPAGWIQTVMTRLAGGEPVWTEADLSVNSWRKISFEQIALWDPAHLFIISYKSPATPILRELGHLPQWQQLKAFRQGTILPVPADMLNYVQSDSRWILGLQWLAATLHPYEFPEFDMEREIRSFYRDFYGITEEPVLETLIGRYRASMTIR